MGAGVCGSPWMRVGYENQGTRIREREGWKGTPGGGKNYYLCMYSSMCVYMCPWACINLRFWNSPNIAHINLAANLSKPFPWTGNHSLYLVLLPCLSSYSGAGLWGGANQTFSVLNHSTIAGTVVSFNKPIQITGGRAPPRAEISGPGVFSGFRLCYRCPT